MPHCVNHKHPEITPLSQEFNLSPKATAAVIAVWQERTGEMDRFPTVEEFSSELQPVSQPVESTKPITEVKEGVAELFKSNPELSKIGTPEQYSSYLDTIFPDSKVKGIVWRGGDVGNIINKEEGSYFTGQRRLAENYAKGTIGHNRIIRYDNWVERLHAAVLDIKNPQLGGLGGYSKVSIATNKDSALNLDMFEVSDVLKTKLGITPINRTIDDILNNLSLFNSKLINEITTKSSSQIHILGSKQDIEGFREFVKDNATKTTPKVKRNEIDPLIRSKYFPTDTVQSLNVVKKIAESNHPLNKLAEILIPHVQRNNVDITLVPVEVLSVEGVAKSPVGVYYPGLNNIEIAEYATFRGRGSEVTLLHEIIHALTVKELENKDSKAVQDINKLYEYTKEKLGAELYGLKNIEEFVTELFTNAEFAKELMKIQPSNEIGEYQNLFEEVLDYILSMFGLGSKQNLYSQAFAVASNIIEDYSSNNFNMKDYNEVMTSSDPDYMGMEREPFASQAVISDNDVPRPYFHVVTSKMGNFIKPAVVDNTYIPEIKNSSNRRYITNKYFRFRHSDNSDSIPYYPFATGAEWANNRLIGMINSEFLAPVVQLDTETNTIVFTDTVDTEMSVREVDNILYKYVEKPKMQERLDSIQEDIVGEEEYLFLEIDPEAAKQGANKQKEEADLSVAEQVINRKKELIRLMQKRIASGSERRAEVQARIDRLQAQINELVDKMVPIEVIRQGKEDAIEITNRLNKIEATLERVEKYDAAQLWSIISELNDVGSFINGWLDVSKFLDFTGTELRDDITKDIQTPINEAKIKQVRLLAKAFLEHANKTSFKKFTEQDLMGALVDEGMLSRLTLGAHFSNSDIVKIVNDAITRAAYFINKESYEKRKETDLWLDKLKKHTGLNSEVEISKMFLQFDSKGNWTGNIVGKIRQEYFDRKRELRETAKNSGNDLDWKKYYDFIKANSIEMTMDIYNSRKHSSFTDEDFAIQDRLLKDYESAKESYKTHLEESGLYGEMKDGVFVFQSDELKTKFDATIAEWVRLNQPFDSKTGKPITIKGGNNWKYRLIEKPDSSKWADPNYQKIEKDPMLKGFYDFLLDRLRENNTYLPHFSGIQSNYLPEMRKTSVEIFSENKGLATAMSLLKDASLDVVSEAAESEVESGVTIAGVTYKSIPVRMMGDNLDPNQKSMNIFKVVKSHTKMALNYKYKSEVEPLAVAAQDIIREVKEVEEVNADGTTKLRTDIYDIIIGKTGQLVNTKKRLEYLVNAELYEQRKKSEAKGKKVKTKSTGEGVVLSQAKMVDSLIKFTYVKALSIPNVITPAVNLTLGIGQNYIYAAAGKNITNSSLNWAYGKMLKTLSNRLVTMLDVKDTEMIVAWMRHLNVLDDINEAAYGDAETWDKWLTQLQSKGEYINQGAVMLAYLKNNKLKDKNGEDISIIDAFKIEDGVPVWDVDKMGDMTIPQANEIVSADNKGVNMYRLRMKIKGINFYIHGDYASALQGKETSLGRAAMLFKTWLFQTWMYRFGGERFDPNLQETVKGRYKSYLKSTTIEGANLAFKDIMKLMMKGIFSKRAFDVLSEVDKDNLIRNLRELQIISAFTVAGILLLEAVRGEDDPERKKTLILLVNTISKTQSDMAFYLNPSNAGQILNNLIAPINTVNDLMSLGNAMLKTASGNFEYEAGPHRGRNRMMITMGRNLPVANGAIKMYNMATQTYSFN